MRIRKSALLLSAFILIVLAFPTSGFSVTITDSVTNPGTAIGTVSGLDDAFIYGDFTIRYSGSVWTGDAEDVSVGEGLDESWDWSFDYTGLYDPSVFNESTVLSSALLTIRLTANSAQVDPGDSEYLRILWLDNFALPAFTKVDEEEEFVVDLLDYYSSAQIMERFMSTSYDGTGTIPMRFIDDAVVNYAELSLTTSPVPPPAAIVLLGSGLAGLAGIRRKFKKI
jgi:hypothetical protein